jgi:hypothetical protein
MESFEYLKDEEILYMLRRIGIRQKTELDIALAEYKKYWKTLYLAELRSDNNSGSLVHTMGRKD